MMPALSLFVELHASSYIIFTIAAFFALCAAVSYLMSSTFENNRRDALAQAAIRTEFEQLQAHTGGAVVRTDEEEVHPHLEWPDSKDP